MAASLEQFISPMNGSFQQSVPSLSPNTPQSSSQNKEKKSPLNKNNPHINNHTSHHYVKNIALLDLFIKFKPLLCGI